MINKVLIFLLKGRLYVLLFLNDELKTSFLTIKKDVINPNRALKEIWVEDWILRYDPKKLWLCDTKVYLKEKYINYIIFIFAFQNLQVVPFRKFKADTINQSSFHNYFVKKPIRIGQCVVLTFSFVNLPNHFLKFDPVVSKQPVYINNRLI